MRARSSPSTALTALTLAASEKLGGDAIVVDENNRLRKRPDGAF
jgi:hypothetical protein